MTRAALAACLSIGLASLAGCSNSSKDAAPTTVTPVAVEATSTLPVSTDAPTATQTTPAPTTATPATAAPTTTVPATLSEDDLVRYMTTIERVVAGTSAAGLVTDQPAEYIALGQVACAGLADGGTIEQVAADIHKQLDPDMGADTGTLSGALVGAAQATICPTTQP